MYAQARRQQAQQAAAQPPSSTPAQEEASSAPMQQAQRPPARLSSYPAARSVLNFPGMEVLSRPCCLATRAVCTWWNTVHAPVIA